MKDVAACLTMDEAIGQSRQSYQKCLYAGPESRVFENSHGGSYWDFCVIWWLKEDPFIYTEWFRALDVVSQKTKALKP